MTDTAIPGDPSGIFMWQRLDERLTSSGQPAQDQLAILKGLGIAHVINLGLHTHEKALPDEAGSVRALGMGYIHIPVDFGNPAEEDYARFSAVMRELAGEMIHVHCIANMRASAFLYRYRRDGLGMAEPEARQEMERVWRPGGVWARFIGDAHNQSSPHQLAGRDYPCPAA